MITNKSGFDKGDKVRLKSGGPNMIVQSVSGDIILCKWVGQHGKISEVFASLLEKVDSELPYGDSRN